MRTRVFKHSTTSLLEGNTPSSLHGAGMYPAAMRLDPSLDSADNSSVPRDKSCLKSRDKVMGGGVNVRIE